MAPTPARAPRPTRRLAGAALAAAIAVALPLAAPAPALAFDAASARGVDVSKWQHPSPGSIDWAKVAAAGRSFAIIKATDGDSGTSPHFAADSAKAHAAGLVIGAYHMGRPGKPARAQADEFIAALAAQPAGAATLPPVLDLEYTDGRSPAQIAAWAREFLDRVAERTGRTPMIYTFRWFWDVEMAGTEDFRDHPLWLAAYQSTAPTALPGGWERITVWQTSGSGRVDGVVTPVDLNTFNGDEAALRAWARGGGAAPAPRGDAPIAGGAADPAPDAAADAPAPAPGAVDGADPVPAGLLEAIAEAIAAGGPDPADIADAVRGAVDGGLTEDQAAFLLAVLELLAGSSGAPAGADAGAPGPTRATPLARTTPAPADLEALTGTLREMAAAAGDTAVTLSDLIAVLLRATR
ncbi:glycoside hydrolase family 25 protein [Corynebacterium sphenisci]|uniref:glycoside hydrolase family 25 protein n=1 Tax=Corynebacterium sphenisci TaxID=191493 RepID=UPI0026E08AE3|nr:GH25 family lysozyme [Corynebacterium sphenisci]MDO5730440.1 GH25 family lysozyme [Corynebacterium sphenisci]